MTLWGVLVVCCRGRDTEVGSALRGMPGVEIHHGDPAGRLVLTIEAPTSEGCAERLRAIQGLPGVRSAEMAVHVFEDEGHP